MSVTKLSKSKSLKVLLVAIVFIFSFQVNVNKPKALAPLIGIGIQVVGGLLVSEMVEMGIKAGSRAVVKKQADNFAKMALNEKNIYGLTFMRTNPYRNKDGSLVINPSINDRAKMAGIIAGSTVGSMLGLDEDGDGLPDGCYTPPTGGAIMKWYDTSGQSQPLENKKYLEKYLRVYKIPLLEKSTRVYWVSNVTGDVISEITVPYSFANVIGGLASYETFGVYMKMDDGDFTIWNPSPNYIDKQLIEGKNYQANKAAFAEAGATQILCSDLVIPSTVKRVYPLPLDTPDDYKMPNASDIPNKPIVIQNFFPPSDEEGPVTWEQIANDFSEDDIAKIMDSHIDSYTEKGNIINNPYTVGVINNYYTDINYPVKIEDFKPPTSEILPPSVPEDNLPAEPVDDLDHSMWEVLRNTYKYLDDGIDSSLAAMKGITDSAKGITDYLASAMGWLPPEWRAVFTSAFVLGVFAHFLRR